MYYIIFSNFEIANNNGSVIAKRYYGEPTEEQIKFCSVFGFTILNEEEFNNITKNTVKTKIIL